MALSKNALLKCEKLCFGYKGRAFADPLDFELTEGEVVALMGENGCGKSTFLKTAAGLVPPVSGSATLLCSNSGSPRERAKMVALVRMGSAAPDRLTVREFVSLGRSPYAGLFDGRSAHDEQVIDEAIGLLELREFENRPLCCLSDGERSRAYLAEAVAQQVRVLLLDEPNAFLDIPRSHKLFKLLRQLARERHMGIVVSTHSVEYAEKYSDRIMVINGGRVAVEKAENARAVGLLDWTCSEE